MVVFFPSIIDLHRNSFQEEIEMRSNGIQILKLHSVEFKKIEWIEKGREFNWFGKLYDVKGIKKTSSGFEIECVNDEGEESLIAFFEVWKKNFPFGNSKLKLDPPFVFFYPIVERSEVFLKPTAPCVVQYYYLEVADLIPHPPEAC